MYVSLSIKLRHHDYRHNKMYARRTRSFSKARIRSSNSASVNKSSLTTDKIVYIEYSVYT